MKNKTIHYKPLSRKDISNPFHRVPHDDLLIKAGVIDLTDNYEVVRSDEKRLVIKPINPHKKLTRKKR